LASHRVEVFKLLICQLAQPFAIGFVGQGVLTGAGGVAGIEVGIGQGQGGGGGIGGLAGHVGAVGRHHRAETGLKKGLGFGRGELEREGLERPDFRQHPDKVGKDAGPKPGLFVLPAVLPAKLPGAVALQVIAPAGAGAEFQNVLAFVVPSRTGGHGHQLAHGEPETRNAQVHVQNHLAQFQAVSLQKGPFQHRLAHLKSNFLVVILGMVLAAGQLHHIERELELGMLLGRLVVGDDVAKLSLQLGIYRSHGAVGALGVAVDIGHVVR